MNNKKGVSAMIETVLLILVVIAAVGIVAGLLVPMIRTAAERASTCQGLVDITSASTTVVNFIQAKDPSPSSINSTVVTWYKIDGTVAGTNDTGVPAGVGKSTTGTITGTGATKAVIQIVIKTGSGKLVTCPAIESQVA